MALPILLPLCPPHLASVLDCCCSWIDKSLCCPSEAKWFWYRWLLTEEQARDFNDEPQPREAELHAEVPGRVWQAYTCSAAHRLHYQDSAICNQSMQLCNPTPAFCAAAAVDAYSITFVDEDQDVEDVVEHIPPGPKVDEYLQG
jgi:hypothetical protein